MARLIVVRLRRERTSKGLKTSLKRWPPYKQGIRSLVFDDISIHLYIILLIASFFALINNVVPISS